MSTTNKSTAPYCVQVAGMPGAYRVETEHGNAVISRAGPAGTFNVWLVQPDGSLHSIESVRGNGERDAATKVAALLAGAA